MTDGHTIFEREGFALRTYPSEPDGSVEVRFFFGEECVRTPFDDGSCEFLVHLTEEELHIIADVMKSLVDLIVVRRARLGIWSDDESEGDGSMNAEDMRMKDLDGLERIKNGISTACKQIREVSLEVDGTMPPWKEGAWHHHYVENEVAKIDRRINDAYASLMDAHRLMNDLVVKTSWNLEYKRAKE